YCIPAQPERFCDFSRTLAVSPEFAEQRYLLRIPTHGNHFIPISISVLVGRARVGSLLVPLRRGDWSLDEIADAEMRHMRDRFGAVIVTEFRSCFLAGIHSGDSGATGVMGRPLRNVVDLPRDDDPAIVSRVVQ